MTEDFKTLEFKDGKLVLIDQRKLPSSLEYVEASSVEDVYFAIKDMIVRGAPLIGAVAAYGAYFAAIEAKGDKKSFLDKLSYLLSSRPTAVNLSWALERQKRVAENTALDSSALLKEAQVIEDEDRKVNRKLSEYGAEVIKENANVLTHCNAGALATCGWGTALGVIKEAYCQGKNIHVYADETRPRLQGARLTSWELVRAGIPATLIPDSAAATLIREGKIDVIVLGADRITVRGDVANKLGTFPLSIIAKEYNVPFYSAAPVSTIDFSLEEGKDIPIEERSKDEVIKIEESYVAPKEIFVFNPSFDVTPHENITGIITERGIIYPPFKENILKLKKELD